MTVTRGNQFTLVRDSSRTTGRPRARIVAILLAAGLTIPVLPAGAGDPSTRRLPAPWTPIVALSPVGVGVADPDVEVDVLGTTTAAWLGASGRSALGLVVRRKPAGAGWQPAQVLDDRGQGSVDIESDTTGAVTIAYGRQRGARPRAVPIAVTANPSGVFAEPVRLSTEGVFHDRVHLVVAPDGTATAAWIAVLEGDARRVAVAQRPPGGAWQPARYLTGTGTRVLELAVDVGSTGEVTVLWTSRVLNVGSNARTVHARSLTGGGWSRTATLSAPEEDRAFDLELAAGARGAAWASWVHLRNFTPDHQVFARRRLDGNWMPPRKLPGHPGFGAAEMQVAAGRTAMMWTSSDPASGEPAGEFLHLLARVRENGEWSAPVRLTEKIESVLPTAIEADHRGRFRAIWEVVRPFRFVGWEYQVQTRQLGTGGRWSDLVRLSSRRVNFFSTAMSLGPSRAVAVVWSQMNPTTEQSRIRATGIDAP